MAKHVSTTGPRSTASAKTNRKPRAIGAGAVTSALQSTLAASLALLDRPAVPTGAYRIAWGYQEGRTVIAKETPYSLELQAARWQDLIETVEGLGEAAAAIEDWRKTHTLMYGSVGLAVAAGHAASLVTTLHARIQTVVDLSPTLRASLRRLEARQAKTGGAA